MVMKQKNNKTKAPAKAKKPKDDDSDDDSDNDWKTSVPKMAVNKGPASVQSKSEYSVAKSTASVAAAKKTVAEKENTTSAAAPRSTVSASLVKKNPVKPAVLAIFTDSKTIAAPSKTIAAPATFVVKAPIGIFDDILFTLASSYSCMQGICF